MAKGTITSFFAPKNPKPVENNKKRSHKETTNDNDVKKQKGGVSDEVVELLNHMDLECWKKALDKHITSPKFAKLAKFVSMER